MGVVALLVRPIKLAGLHRVYGVLTSSTTSLAYAGFNSVEVMSVFVYSVCYR